MLESKFEKGSVDIGETGVSGRRILFLLRRSGAGLEDGKVGDRGETGSGDGAGEVSCLSIFKGGEKCCGTHNSCFCYRNYWCLCWL